MVTISEFDFANPHFLTLLNRRQALSDEVEETVKTVIREVREHKDKALFRYMQDFDQADITAQNIRVSEQEIAEAAAAVAPAFAQALQKACDNLFKYHQYQLPKEYSVSYEDGVQLTRKYRPIERVGICVPGLAAPLGSTLYMNLIPALVAGVPEICLISPPKNNRLDKHILFIADFLGVKDIYKISGAQGVAALAFGTQSVPAVDKIVGPGGVYVQLAKQLVYGTVGIDSLAGPSELAIIADNTANAEFVAADMLSQAEHGSGLEASCVFCLSRQKAEEIKMHLLRLIVKNDLEGAVSKSLKAYGNIFITDSLEMAAQAINALAPEHAQIIGKQAEKLADRITNAGALFVGAYSPEPVGDYFCGTNHVLPTNGTARFSSGLGVNDFLRAYSIIEYTREALFKNAQLIKTLAEAEGMRAHALSVQVRLKE